MLFNSITFLLFFVIVVLINGLLAPCVRRVWILLASLVFYASWSLPFIVLLLFTAAVDYFIALKMGTFPNDSYGKRQRKPWLLLSLFFGIGSLVFFKYSNMLVQTSGLLAGWFGLHWSPPVLNVFLPLGISFYTFETISYSIDVYRGELEPRRNFINYLGFLMFFPKLIAGPIVRASELLPQIQGLTKVLTEERFSSAINLMVWGFAKKVLLADNFAPFIEKVFANPQSHNRWMCIVAVYGYSMQVYFDFSAYSDIARGCAKLLGYDLPENFNKPYLAVSVADFWRRWHMTLSRWLRDYVYIPLGGSHKSRLLTYRNLFLTMLIGGLWHGAQWTFVFWGALNGAFLLLEREWYHLRGTVPRKIHEMGWVERVVRTLFVFHLITFTRIFFRSQSFSGAIEMIRSIVRPTTVVAEYNIGLVLLPFMTILYVLISPLKRKLMLFEPKRFALVGYAFVLVVLLGLGATQAEFIYFQF